MKTMTEEQRKAWEMFRQAGLLWWVNMILHTFGWAIVYQYDKNKKLLWVHPERVRFRGFSEKVNSEGYIKVSEYLKENISDLLEEAKE